MTEEAGFVELGGTRLEYRWWSRADRAATLVLLHEGLGSVGLWRDFPDRLARATGLPVFAYSRRGYGRSSPRAWPLGADHLHREALEILSAVLRAQEIARPVLVGHSDGGSIALIHAGAGGTPPPFAVVTIAAHVFLEPVTFAGLRAAGVAWREGDLRARLMRHHGDNVEGAFRGWHDTWTQPSLKDWSIVDLLPAIRVPVLALQGERDDHGTPDQVAAIVAGVGPSARGVMLPDCGHAPHRDQPERVTAEIAGFLVGLGLTRP
jgi:pimeloyl-ACP methyl ester carboxylesterase